MINLPNIIDILITFYELDISVKTRVRYQSSFWITIYHIMGRETFYEILSKRYVLRSNKRSTCRSPVEQSIYKTTRVRQKLTKLGNIGFRSQFHHVFRVRDPPNQSRSMILASLRQVHNTSLDLYGRSHQPVLQHNPYFKSSRSSAISKCMDTSKTKRGTQEGPGEKFDI